MVLETFERKKIVNFLKGQSNEIFDLLFFSSFQPAWATDQWVKIFSYLVSFSPKYSNFNCEKTDLPAKKKFCLRTVLQKYKMQPFNGKIRIHFYFCATVPLKACAKVLRNGCWLPSPQGIYAVWYPREIDSAQYDTLGRFLRKIR